jgi:hypothetical protein
MPQMGFFFVLCVVTVGKDNETHVVAQTLEDTLVVMNMLCCAQVLQQIKASLNHDIFCNYELHIMYNININLSIKLF